MLEMTSQLFDDHRLLTFIAVGCVNVKIEIFPVAQSRNTHNLTLDLKNRQTRAVEVDLKSIFARLEAEEDG